LKTKKRIPTKYTCDGDDVNPPLTIEGASKETRSLVLIIDDPDAAIGMWNHGLYGTFRRPIKLERTRFEEPKD